MDEELLFSLRNLSSGEWLTPSTVAEWDEGIHAKLTEEELDDDQAEQMHEIAFRFFAWATLKMTFGNHGDMCTREAWARSARDYRGRGKGAKGAKSVERRSKGTARSSKSDKS